MSSPIQRLGALAASAVLTVGLAGCADDSDPTPTSGETTATQDPSTEPSTEPSTPVESTEPTEATGTTLPIYFAGDGPDHTRLFREFVAGTSGDPLTEAAEIVDGGTATDPDYRTLWPGDTIASVEAGADVIDVRLEGEAFTMAPDGMAKRDARLAIQQLVYTLQAVQQERVSVQFHRDAGPATLFGLSIEKPFKQASALKVLNHVSITTPAEGASVAQGPLKVEGVANSFEGNVVCAVEGSGDPGTPFTAEGYMEDRLFPFSGELDFSQVGPGEITLACRTDDPSDGEGVGAMTDTKTITVN